MASDPTTVATGAIDADQSRRIGVLEEKIADLEKDVGGIRGTWRGLRRSRSFRNGFFSGMIPWVAIGFALCYLWKGSLWDFTRSTSMPSVQPAAETYKYTPVLKGEKQ